MNLASPVRAITARGTGVSEVPTAVPQPIAAEGSGLLEVTEIVSAAVRKHNWQR